MWIYLSSCLPVILSSGIHIFYNKNLTYRTSTFANLLRLKSRMWMQGGNEGAGLIILAPLRSLRTSRPTRRGAPRALCTETGLLLGALGLPPPVPPRVTHRRTTLVLRVVLVLVMVRRRCIHTAFKPSSGAAIQWKKKTKSIRDRKGGGQGQIKDNQYALTSKKFNRNMLRLVRASSQY